MCTICMIMENGPACMSTGLLVTASCENKCVNVGWLVVVWVACRKTPVWRRSLLEAQQ